MLRHATRTDRRHGKQHRIDQRTEGQRDRDRILYSSAFRRLAGVTQVVGPLEGHVFHNRLTHTLEVAQIARRLAEHLAEEHPRIAQRLGGLDPDVVEAAALAHDLGHPPFGHIAEKCLDELARRAGDPDGFEGNAQSFRIVTKLSSHRSPETYRGLNLTRATLNAVLKYPWLRKVSDRNSKHYRKFGAYRTEAADVAFARTGMGRSSRPSLEASIMDYADGAAYSVHDLDDFTRAGLITVEHLKHDPASFEIFLKRWIATGRVTRNAVKKYRDQLLEILWLVVPSERPYSGSFADRAERRTIASQLIDRYVKAATLIENGLTIPYRVRLEQGFLQRVVWEQVITAPSLSTQHAGQKRIIDSLFGVYLDAIKRRDRDLVPPAYAPEIEALPKNRSRHSRAAIVKETRLAVDIVAGMTDQQAYLIHARLAGFSPGSVVDLYVG